MRAYMGHVWGSPIGRAGKGFPVIPFPSLLRGRELPSLRSLPFPSPVPFPGRGREGIPYPIPQRNYSSVVLRLRYNLVLITYNLGEVLNIQVNSPKSLDRDIKVIKVIN